MIEPVDLDVDGVLANFQKGFIRRARDMGLDFYEHYQQWDAWEVHDRYKDSFQKVAETIDGHRGFWVGLPKIETHIPFEVGAYVSARSAVPKRVTQAWLSRKGFPTAEVHVVEDSSQKLRLYKNSVVEGNIFVDDKIRTVRRFQDAWTPENQVPVPVLKTAPHNSPHGRENTTGIWLRANYLPEVPGIVERFLKLNPSPDDQREA